MEGPTPKFFQVLIAIVVIIVIVLVCGQSITAFGDKRHAEGVDSGAMLIINDIVAGRNISYNALDRKEYKIELFTESVQWYEHEKQDTKCSACHKYSTQYLQEGGKGK